MRRSEREDAPGHELPRQVLVVARGGTALGVGEESGTPFGARALKPIRRKFPTARGHLTGCAADPGVAESVQGWTEHEEIPNMDPAARLARWEPVDDPGELRPGGSGRG